MPQFPLCKNMRRSTVSALTLSLALAWGPGAGAEDLVSVAQKAAVSPDFVQAVRAALVENPEIILEVLAVLEAEQKAEKANKDLALLDEHADEIFAGLDRTKPILIEFQDYNCSYCRRVHPDVTAVRAATPDLQLVVLEFPILGEDSTYTAEMALAVKALYGRKAYLSFVDTVMSLDSPANPATVLRIVNLLDFDSEALTKTAKGKAVREELQRAAYLARTLGVRGTPAFVGPQGIARGAMNRAALAQLTIPATQTGK